VRTVDIAWLSADRTIETGQRRVPVLPVFDEAIAAFAQGTPFKTPYGIIPVEDLQPGDILTSETGEEAQITWIGSALFSPTEIGARIRLTRIMTDSFGPNRPERFVTFGPVARLLKTPPDLRSSTAAAPMATPASRFLDGVNVIDLAPPTPVRLFHIGLPRHAAISAAGLPVESYHPGLAPMAHLSEPLRQAFAALFPQISTVADFGPLRFARAPALHDAATG
jgi:hypothetical protein